MGSRLSKRKHLGVPDKSTDQKAEKAAAKTTEENEACPISGTVLETPEEAESLQSLMETTELKIKRGQEPQIPANRTGQEGGEHAAISKEEILNASEMDISVDAESELQQYTEQEDQSASLGASCELPQTLEPSSETQAFQPLESIVTAVDERGVQGEPKQTFSAFETQGRKGEMALHSDCGPTGSEASYCLCMWKCPPPRSSVHPNCPPQNCLYTDCPTQNPLTLHWIPPH
uniref:Uncharacterized protein n=1 Tax=Chelonoidis abingdonii TaxID=106734 RepID=A0A8C0GBM5_CHEAB